MFSTRSVQQLPDATIEELLLEVLQAGQVYNLIICGTVADL
jgi:hypothetical protein